MRTVPKKFLGEFLTKLDTMVSNMIAAILEDPLSEDQLIQCHLPLSHGGLGIMAAKNNIVAIKIAKWEQTHDKLKQFLVERNYLSEKVFFNLISEFFDLKLGFRNMIGMDSIEDFTDKQWKTQRFLTNKIADKQIAPLYERSNGYHQAWINGCRPMVLQLGYKQPLFRILNLQMNNFV